MAILRRLLCALMVLLPVTTAAMDAEKRPDLVPRLMQLQSIYSKNWGPERFNEGIRDATVFHLSGRINPGDTDRIREVLQSTWGKLIVIDSPGGSFVEGIALGQYLKGILESQDPDIYGIFVLRDGPCLSACALAVALATSTRDIAYGDDARFVEHGAELGFHMGLLPEAQATQAVEARQMMNVTYDIVQAYASLIMGGVAPPILLSEALEHREANSFFYLRGGIRTHAMRLTPVGPPILSRPIHKSALMMDTVAALCRTAFVAAPDVRRSFVDYEFGYIEGINPDPVTTNLEDMTNLLGSRRIAGSLNGAAHCVVELFDNGTIGLDMIAGPPPCQADGRQFCAVPVDRFQPRSAPVALLADTYGCHSGSPSTRGQFWSGDLNGASDYVTDVDPTQTAVRGVNMRAQPSLNAAVAGQLRAEQQVEVSDCRIVDDVQGVWMQVRAGGQTGWVSARFLSPYRWSDLRPLIDGPAPGR
ncbi:SH3 domain-containing protein [Antarctobacter heliothermus]|uniref:SH3 domain-containing protein n=1 Tax=Antarctobacter heliothermus TaxID=74033 RepID=A0A239CEE0_9RHOB|nr:SH3 domain-containing protein [Antarctobacter heliothermus]SNS18319.1 SH3 domain-containing protein [Antarctobacter heliothermus]